MFPIYAIPFYKKRSYKKRPIKFFNHDKQQPIKLTFVTSTFELTLGNSTSKKISAQNENIQ